MNQTTAPSPVDLVDDLPIMPGGPLLDLTRASDRILASLVIAEIDGLDTYTALLAALMVDDGCPPGEAVELAAEDAHDERTKRAVARAKDLTAYVLNVQEAQR